MNEPFQKLIRFIYVFLYRCQNADVVQAYIHVDNQLEKIAEYCGYSIPPPLIASGHRLTLEFSGASSSNYARGFHATYSFVEG